MEGGRPRMVRKETPGRRLVRVRKVRAEQAEKRDWTVLRKRTERNLSAVGGKVVER